MGHNWGWSILILTICINLAVLPLRITSMKSALKMQKIQPQVSAIREKYKKYKMGDPKQAEMNQELGALYKAEGVNMFGGCLPMLIQFPILIAFYNMLAKAVDLRHAHWLWLPDLSRPDALHILPVFFIVTMFLTQYLTPAPGMDPAQKKMMAFMMPGDVRLLDMEHCFGRGAVLGRGKHHRHRQPVGDEPQQPRQPDAGAVADKRARRKAGQGKIIQGKR